MYLKSAMWGVGLILLGAFGFFLIEMFGNITVTNQQDYTTMKNAVEAAMYDSIDMARYRSGFCVCTSKGNGSATSFETKSEYWISDMTNDQCPSTTGINCRLIEGDYKIRSKVFAESLVRRFSENVKPKDYVVTVKDIIEYPPKVSVIISSHDEATFGRSAAGEDVDFTIVNQIDAILELKNGSPIITSTVN